MSENNAKALFLHDPRHRPLAYTLSHWGTDPYIQGAWSQLAVGGSPHNREVLGSKISSRLILAGEACHVKYPAMVHGAALSGIHAANEMLDGDRVSENVTVSAALSEKDETLLPVVVIGAGAAGIFAASTAQSLSRGKRRVLVLEAKDRIGGRVQTVTLTARDHSRPVQVDLGAQWLQQFPDNFLARHAEAAGLDLSPTDFHCALCAASDNLPVHDLHDVVEDLYDVAEAAVNAASSLEKNEENKSSDISVLEALMSHISSLPAAEQRQAQLALCGDINSDFGYPLHDTSAKHSLSELGIGNGDHFIKQGYESVLEPVARELDIRLNTAVQDIDWSAEDCVAVTTATGRIIRASHCICTVPISLLKQTPLQAPAAALTFIPPLPDSHCQALRHIHQGKCEKVVLRYSTRWWPHCPNGLYRWYDNKPSGAEGHYRPNSPSAGALSAPLMLNWNEWLDLTDCVGAPVMIGFCVGEEACSHFHGGDKSDADIAEAAARAFEEWAWERLQLEKGHEGGSDV